MHGEDLLINDGSYRQAVEAIGKRLPKLDVIPPLAFIVETVNTVDRSALMISTQNEEVLRVLDLVRKKKADGFQRLLATIYIIPKEEIVRFGREAAILKQTQEIVILAMDIATYLDKNNSLALHPR